MVSDLDGVVWRGRKTLPGAVELFARLRRLGVPYVFATNNSGKVPAQYAERLTAIGIPVTACQVVTSGVVTARYLSGHYPPGSSVHVLGSPALVAVLTEAGFEVVGGGAAAPTGGEDVSHSPPLAVVASIDRELSYEKLAAATSAILGGADFIGTNGDPTFPVPGGLLPGSGSVIAALEAASGRRAKLMGKPEAPIFDHALEVLGAPPGRTLMIGDRLDTDVAGAKRAGLLAALVLTGATAEEQLAAHEHAPDFVFTDLLALADAW